MATPVSARPLELWRSPRRGADCRPGHTLSYPHKTTRAGSPGPWPISTFFEIRFKIKWLEKECIFQSFDQNKVHFNQNLGSKSSAFQASESKAVKSSAAASPAADLARDARRAKAGMAAQDARRRGHHQCRFRIFRRRGGGTGVTSRECREVNFDQNKVEA